MGDRARRGLGSGGPHPLRIGRGRGVSVLLRHQAVADIPDSRGAGARLVGCGAGCQPGCGGAGHPRQAPVQNSPGTPQNADFGPFSGCWANFVTLGLQTDHAGRTLYRIRGLCRYKALPARTPGGPTRYKTLPAYGPHALNRYKTLPACPKAPISAHFPHAGRVLYRFHHQQAEQGEESHAPAPRLTPPTHPPPIPHAIRLHEISTTSRNVAIPTITFQLLKYSEGNCMRNWLRSQQ